MQLTGVVFAPFSEVGGGCMAEAAVGQLGWVGPLPVHAGSKCSTVRNVSSLLQVKSELAVVDKTNAAVQSFARVNFQEACEAAINEQIK